MPSCFWLTPTMCLLSVKANWHRRKSGPSITTLDRDGGEDIVGFISFCRHLLPGPEVLVELRHLVKEANLGYKHEDQGDRNPGVVPVHLVDGEFLLDVNNLEVQGEVRGIRENLGLFHFHLFSARKCTG